jgi:transcriptional regulator with XRE-family HTH domain
MLEFNTERLGGSHILLMQKVSSEQIRDARNLLRIAGEEFCAMVGIGRRTLQRIEYDQDLMERTAYGTIMKIVETLEEAGVEFLTDGTVKKRSGGISSGGGSTP